MIIIDNGGLKSTGMQKFILSIDQLLCGIDYTKSSFDDLSNHNINNIIDNMISENKTSVWLIEDYEKKNGKHE